MGRHPKSPVFQNQKPGPKMVWAKIEVCPIPLPTPIIGDALIASQIVEWFFQVRQLGIKKNEFLTKLCITRWANSLVEFEEFFYIADCIEIYCPDDQI